MIYTISLSEFEKLLYKESIPILFAEKEIQKSIKRTKKESIVLATLTNKLLKLQGNLWFKMNRTVV